MSIISLNDFGVEVSDMNPEVQASIVIVAGQWVETMMKMRKRAGADKPAIELLKQDFDAMYDYLYKKLDTKV